MKIRNEALIQELLEITQKSTRSINKIRTLAITRLKYKSNSETWSVLECIEHLNLYGDFYLPVIEQAILSNESSKFPGVFRSGIIGNYFVNLIRVKSGAVKKMSAQKEMNPLNCDLTITTVDRFLKQQQHLESLLIQAKAIDLVKAKTPVSLTRLLKLRLGDTLRFLVYHIERHVLQAERIAD
ncbi:DinB superfamily protein [Pedobacter steynii]|uniref:DinB superfamily protein n=1 Tax=Pedobacter steynii TaxID=430522 RepID=A0A1G9Z2A4_9SPHI|nr:DinB family protein [Pedobacter steynii]NQX39921.1 DinB family protein [Pedobacter steynii]SDN15444.1 DinB superfamily protein [Pedobacter steynii]